MRRESSKSLRLLLLERHPQFRVVLRAGALGWAWDKGKQAGCESPSQQGIADLPSEAASNTLSPTRPPCSHCNVDNPWFPLLACATAQAATLKSRRLPEDPPRCKERSKMLGRARSASKACCSLRVVVSVTGRMYSWFWVPNLRSIAGSFCDMRHSPLHLDQWPKLVQGLVGGRPRHQAVAGRRCSTAPHF